MTSAQYRTFGSKVYALIPHAYPLRRGDARFVNFLLDEFIAMVNLICVCRGSNIPGNGAALATIMARFLLMCIGTDAHTYAIIADVWGADDNTRHLLGGERGDLQLVYRRLTTNSKVATNFHHIWFNGPKRVISEETVNRLPSIMQSIFAYNQSHDAVTFVRDPASTGTEKVKIIMTNVQNGNTTIPPDTAFHALAARWYHEHLLNNDDATDDTGVDNGIFDAFGITFGH